VKFFNAHSSTKAYELHPSSSSAASIFMPIINYATMVHGCYSYLVHYSNLVDSQCV